jgi:PBP1b-binding outer membrane lipoprotein LpoB
MSKIDDLERMLEDAKREEAQKNLAWIKYVIYFFIVVLLIRGCSGDKNQEVQEQAPIEQSAEPIKSYDDSSENNAEPVVREDNRVSTPEDKLESLTGEKINVKTDSVEEIANSTMTEQDESHL